MLNRINHAGNQPCRLPPRFNPVSQAGMSNEKKLGSLPVLATRLRNGSRRKTGTFYSIKGIKTVMIPASVFHSIDIGDAPLN